MVSSASRAFFPPAQELKGALEGGVSLIPQIVGRPRESWPGVVGMSPRCISPL